MKTIMRSLLLMGWILNINAVLSKSEADLSKDISIRSMQSYKSFRAGELTKRNLRYGAGGLGLLGIGGFIYYSWKSENVPSEADRIFNNVIQGTATHQEQAWLRKVLHQGHSATVSNLKERLKARKGTTITLPWSASVKDYVKSTLKSSFFGLTTLGTAMIMTGIQGFGASIFTKGVLNPFAEKFLSIYSINRFLATKTKINQNIKDFINILSVLNKENEDNPANRARFEATFELLEKDIVNILGFVIYIRSLISNSDELIQRKVKSDFVQIKRCLLELHKLKAKDADIDEYKEVLGRLIDISESFSVICDDVGTDFLEDCYGTTFDQLRQSINSDMPAPFLPGAPDMDALAQMLSGLTTGIAPEAN